MAWKVDKELKMDPPIHTKNFLSAGATTLIFMVEGASWVTYLFNLSGIPGYIVVPPPTSILEISSLIFPLLLADCISEMT